MVRVQYVHDEDEKAASDDLVRLGADVHMTRPFKCRECGRFVPLKDTHLGGLVMKLASLRVFELELRDISGNLR
jgi:hypothetical protein